MRLSLSPVLDDDDSDDGWRRLHVRDTSYYSAEDSRNTLTYSDDEDDEEDEEEIPHPLGFSNQGRTRFALDADAESMEHYKRRWGYIHPVDDDGDDYDAFFENGSVKTQSYPPISSYLDPRTAPTSALARYMYQDRSPSVQDDTMDRLAGLLQAAAMISDHRHNDDARALALLPILDSNNSYFSPVAQQQEKDRIAREMQVERLRVQREHNDAAQALMKLLRDDQEKAARIVAEEEENQRKDDERVALEEERLAAENEKRKQKERAIKEQKAAQFEKENQEKEEKEKLAAKEFEHVARAKKVVSHLAQIRASVEPFEKSKDLGKRRLGMKKIVNGKVNTLAENVEKIRSVAAEVSQAIAAARTEDEQIKQQMQGGATLAPEMARGKRYLVDLLCSKVIVRVQAEGFNGQRGDGFPLANMLAQVSVDNKDMNVILEGHIYTVCPIAIPALPSITSDASEDELMEGLGMLRGKDGEFETFQRYLARTEGIISLVADIQSSQPSNHALMSGHEGAVKWLSRFLKCLPDPPSPLPLFTAPVLDAFLTGAGHMLANVHADEFKKSLGKIEADIMNRLDASAAGKPSSIRLQKTIEGGFDKFKTKLPSRALALLYYGANPSSGDHSGGASSASFSSTIGSATTSVMSPFGPPSSTAAPSPFGASNTNYNPSPFGITQANSGTSGPSPFGTSPAGPATTFGAPQQVPASTPFGSSTPFGMVGSAPSPFGTAQSPFGASPNAAPPSSTFGTPAGTSPSPFGTPAAPVQSPFGGGTSGMGQALTGPVQSPFGGGSSGMGQAPSPFGFGAAPTPSPFGSAAQPSRFGGAAAPVLSPFGTAAQPPVPSPFGTAAPKQVPSPFGSAPQPAPTPFGIAGQSAPSTFGSVPQPSQPFGAPFSTSSPFGAPSTSMSPFGQSTQGSNTFGGQNQFGSSANASPFGVSQGSQLRPFGQQSSPFGNTSGGSSGFGSRNTAGGKKRTPCVFFAQGRCKKGDNCRFSHETPQSSFSGGSPFRGPR